MVILALVVIAISVFVFIALASSATDSELLTVPARWQPKESFTGGARIRGMLGLPIVTLEADDWLIVLRVRWLPFVSPVVFERQSVAWVAAGGLITGIRFLRTDGKWSGTRFYSLGDNVVARLAKLGWPVKQPRSTSR